MQPLTQHLHKTLLTVAGQTVIDRILDGLADRGVTPVTIVTGYRADELTTHVARHHPHLDVRYVHNADYETTNNIHSMALAFEHMELDEDVVLIESDLVYEPRVLDRLLASGHPDVALVDRYRAGMDGTVVSLSPSGRITAVITPALQPDNFSFTDKYKTLNIYRFSAALCRDKLCKLLTYYTSTFDRNCYYELVLGMLIYVQQVDVHAEVLDGEVWAEIDDPNDLRIAEYTFNPATRYDTLTAGWGGYWTSDVLDFAFIRNEYFPPPAVLSELRLNLPDLLHSYGSRQSILDQKLAWALQWPAGLVHAVAGASQCYPWLRAWYAGRRVLLPAPTFGEYPRVFPGARTYLDAPGIDWTEVEREAEEADVVVFVNPNNPTGTLLATERIRRFAEDHPATTVVVDESFLDFSDEPSIVGHLADGALPNVLVVKSLSKVLGVPGIRLGVLATSDPTTAARIAEETPIWDLSSVAENFLEIILKHRPALEQSFRQTAADREQLTRLLKDSPGVDAVVPSGGDFVLVRLTGDAVAADTAARRLVERRGVLVKDVSHKMGDGRGWWRIAVRTPRDQDRLAMALHDLGGAW
ncbi:Histidinol-phosphate/aromatic aminotransferase or cobyric acid decarboxylase [Geodermatophilus amargosae]|uniref:Aminotransferase n=2 Tax=Geodermatophilus amargosae TaxID=1296565 RepID=A0A1I6X6Y8_9ACTN|nr:Histidinol-phosphate/aromatic aminotransferase or cobyric acid decarboxylase [Geodermatophilus amargosae]